MLHALILPLMVFFLSPNTVLAKDSYKAEAASRKAEATHLQKAFDGEIKDKALEAQTIIQNHLNGEFAKPKIPCLSTLDSSETDRERGRKQGVQGCKVIPLTQKTEVNRATPIDNTNQVIVFVSFSMPEASLKALFEALDTNPDVKLVMRGLVDDSMDKTARKINDLGGVLEINPELFDRYHITQVPTFVLVKGDESTLKLAGNITLNHAKEIFNKQISTDKLNAGKPS